MGIEESGVLEPGDRDLGQAEVRCRLLPIWDLLHLGVKIGDESPPNSDPGHLLNVAAG